MRIAIVGSGISGLVVAYLLHEIHDITLFEANDYVGGHTRTVPVKTPSGDFEIDTGFIVFNETTYPNFLKILNRIGVESQPSSMSFSVKSLADGLEFNGNSLNTFFAQRENILRATMYKILWDMMRFNRQIDQIIQGTTDNRSLADFLESEGYSEEFLRYFILPMTSALWSAPPTEAREFPIALFARFFRNHGILNLRKRLAWRVIKGGSTRYVEKLITSFADRIRLNCPVQWVTRTPDHVEIATAQGVEHFDQVILAVHSDQALNMLTDPSRAEEEVLGSIRYQANRVQLHTDTRLLPSKRSIWASWNYKIPVDETLSSTVTYDMNILQSITAKEEFLVSLNQLGSINPEKIIGNYLYDHPAYTPLVPPAQDRHNEVSGVNRTHYCGAYWGYGFHEDGVRSALSVCKNFDRGL